MKQGQKTMIKKSIFSTTLLLSLPLLSNIGPQGFGPYRNGNRILVETGTCYGNGVLKALSAGFQEVYTIELKQAFYRNCLSNFSTNPHVHLYCGDSSKDLCTMLADINEPVTFWLDGHQDPPYKDGRKNCPLIEELDQIKMHPIKTHTILIDDMHCCNTTLFDGLTQQDLINKVLEINPNYTITFQPGGDDGEYPLNVLVAEIKN
jgi:hypothetical protein